jgi:ribosomal protein S18 acetylase RimI-like enzyme
MECEIIASSFQVSGLQTWRLDESHSGFLQDLYEQCKDFVQLTTGQPPQPNAARDLLQALPPGKSPQDKFVLGFVRAHTALIGVLDTVCGYPDPCTWYIGLLMFVPQERGQGLGRQVQTALEQWMLRNGGRRLRLIVQAQNVRGFAFWRQGGFELEGTASQTTAIGTNTVYKMVRHLNVSQERTG